MKFKTVLVGLVLLMLNFSSYAQQSKEVKVELDKALKEMTKALEDLDLEHLINEEIFAKIEELKPSKEQINKIEDLMETSIESLNKIDLSGIEELIGEIEMSLDEIDFDKILKEIEEVSPVKKGKKI